MALLWWWRHIESCWQFAEIVIISHCIYIELFRDPQSASHSVCVYGTPSTTSVDHCSRDSHSVCVVDTLSTTSVDHRSHASHSVCVRQPRPPPVWTNAATPHIECVYVTPSTTSVDHGRSHASQSVRVRQPRPPPVTTTAEATAPEHSPHRAIGDNADKGVVLILEPGWECDQDRG